MRITPLNLILPVYLAYVAMSLLELREKHQVRLHQLIFEVKVWHIVVPIAIILLDIILRAFIPDTKKIWLVQALFILFFAGAYHMINTIMPISLFD